MKAWWSSLVRSTGSCWATIRAGLYYLHTRNDAKAEVTEQYPDPVSSRSAEERPERTRGRLRNDIQKCTGCGDCVTVCPAECIELATEEGPKPGRKWISTFTIDHSRCVSCGLCVEACQPQSLVHERAHQPATRTIEEQVASFGAGPVTPGLREQWARGRETDARRKGW